MKRFVLLSVMLTVLLTGCKSNNTDNAIPDSTTTTTTVQVETSIISDNNPVSENVDSEREQVSDSKLAVTTVSVNTDKQPERVTYSITSNKEKTTSKKQVSLNSSELREDKPISQNQSTTTKKQTTIKTTSSSIPQTSLSKETTFTTIIESQIQNQTLSSNDVIELPEIPVD